MVRCASLRGQVVAGYDATLPNVVLSPVMTWGRRFQYAGSEA